MSHVVVSESEDAVVVRLNRPRRRNALTQAMVTDLQRAWAALENDERPLILTGVDESFCAGLDLAEVGDGTLLPDSTFITELRRLKTLKIAAVNGAAVTAGLELALACDIRLATPAARFADTHTRVGIAPGGGVTAVLPRLIGTGRALSMSLSGRFVGAQDAAAWGLVDLLVAEDQSLDQAVALARAVRGGEREVVEAMRELIRRSQDTSLKEALSREQRGFDSYVERIDADVIERRRDGVVAAGRAQLGNLRANTG